MTASIESVLSVILLMSVGYALHRRRIVNSEYAAMTSKVILNVVLPAAVFDSAVRYLNPALVSGLAGGVGYAAFAVALTYVVGYALMTATGVRRGRRGIFVMNAANANTVFVGLPVQLALFGRDTLPYFLAYYVVNTISTWAVGASLIAADRPEGETPGAYPGFSFGKVFTPPLVGFLLGLVVMQAEVPVPDVLMKTCRYVGDAVTPLSLMYIGMMLSKAGLSSLAFDRETVTAHVGRFVLAPVVMIATAVVGMETIGGVTAAEMEVFIVHSAGPSVAVLPILAAEAKGDVAFATNLVTTSTILFAFAVPIVTAILPLLGLGNM